MDIKPIETIYNGYRFRSRLEARWAVFFDAANIKYQYEQEGFDLSNGIYYLPDFYLPDFDVYVEVKGDTESGRKEIEEKCEKAIAWGGPIKQLLILSDIPEGRSIDGGIWHFPIIYWRADGRFWGWWFFHDYGDECIGSISSANYTNSHFYCMREKSIKAVSDENLRRPRTKYDSEFTITDHIMIQENTNNNTFAAFRSARQARFEHGETPVVYRR